MVVRASVAPLGRADLPSVGRLFAAHTGRPADLDQVGTWLDRWPAFGARCAGELVGYLTTARFGPDVLELTSLLLSPDARGQGTGRALLAALDDAAPASGAHAIVAITSSGYETAEPRIDPAPFYERCGYRVLMTTSQSTILARSLEAG